MTTPEQACEDGIIGRLALFYNQLSMREMLDKSGLPEYVPDAVNKLLASGVLVYDNNAYKLKRRTK